MIELIKLSQLLEGGGNNSLNQPINSINFIITPLISLFLFNMIR
jgi:hypothetical protein